MAHPRLVTLVTRARRGIAAAIEHEGLREQGEDRQLRGRLSAQGSLSWITR
jgi:hypothetical protein